MTEQEFIIERQNAVERMKRMAGNSATNENPPNAPSFVKLKNGNKKSETPKNNTSFLGLNGFDLGFLDRIKNDGDQGLILGLILVLFCENSDKLLLLALLYILL